MYSAILEQHWPNPKLTSIRLQRWDNAADVDDHVVDNDDEASAVRKFYDKAQSRSKAPDVLASGVDVDGETHPRMLRYAVLATEVMPIICLGTATLFLALLVVAVLDSNYVRMLTASFGVVAFVMACFTTLSVRRRLRRATTLR